MDRLAVEQELHRIAHQRKIMEYSDSEVQVALLTLVSRQLIALQESLTELTNLQLAKRSSK